MEKDNTPSPGAKQFAQKAWDNGIIDQNGKTPLAAAYDTATAKAREELASWRRVAERLQEQLAHQPLDSARDKQPSDNLALCESHRKAYELAPQTECLICKLVEQPSAPTADCKALPGYKGCATHHWFGSECPYSKRLPQYALPDAFFVYLGETPLAGPMTESAASESAKAITVAFTQRPPTADVEKIARDCAHELHLQAYILEPCDGGLINILKNAIAQARAPLVKDKERLDWLEKVVQWNNPTSTAKIVFTIPTVRHIRLRDAIDAALTGTGEKEALAGKTGNNKEKRRVSDNAR